MLSVDMIARIRRAHFVDGKSIKQITREMGLARNTVRRVLRTGETKFTYERQVQPRPKLGAWTEELERRLRDLDPGLRSLFVSGYTADVIARHGVIDQDVCFLQKPFTLESLGRAVRRALQGRGRDR